MPRFFQPQPMRAALRRLQQRLVGAQPRADRASLAELFGLIYRHKHWGGADDDFYSGSASHTPRMIEPFVAAVRTRLAAFATPPTVVDLGCGDFAAGRRFLDVAGHLHACDVVPELIARNRRLFAAPNLTFHLLDAIADPLPRGDIVIVKQVLQHLGNDQIAAIVRKLSQYPLWIVTEHVPAAPFAPNRDMPASGLTRLALNSGIVLTEKPFRIRPKSTEMLCEVVEDGNPIRTIAYRF